MSHPICPRCGGAIPNNVTPGAYPGALSRWDNKTEVCSDCGASEAFLVMSGEDISPTGSHPWVDAPVGPLMYVAADGNYGDAAGLAIIDTTGWDADDYERLDSARDAERIEVAMQIAEEHRTRSEV